MTTLRVPFAAAVVVVLLSWGGVVRAGEAPQIVEISPKDGAVDVDASLAELRIVFDRDMKPESYSLCGGGETFPKLRGKPTWKNARTFVQRVTLEAEHEYEMSVNCMSFKGFQSADGVPVEPTPWRFSTGVAKARGKVDRKKLNGRSLDELMKAMREDYSYYDRKGVNWKARVTKHRKKIIAAKSTATWVDRVAKMLSAAEDPHLWIKYDGKLVGTYQRVFELNFNLKGVEAAFGKVERRNSCTIIAKTDDDIAYIAIGSWGGDKRKEIAQVQEILAEFREAKVRGLILDVRPNGGGDDRLAADVAGWFVEGEHVYATTVVRDTKAKGGFTPPRDRVITGNEAPRRFEGPVAVLMGPMCLSSCESFLLMMRQGARVKLLGAQSGGSSGNPQSHVLENGVDVMIPSWLELQPDGTLIEGRGVKPDVVVKAEASDFEKGDPVIDRALRLLREEADEKDG